MIRRALVIASLVLVSSAGCTQGPDAGLDAAVADAAGADAHGSACTTAAQCDDGLFCNGTETCTAGSCHAGTPMVCDDAIACTTDRCVEDRRACQHDVPDRDGDGAGDAACHDAGGVALGQDCDDADHARFPGNTEICDALGHDEDCNPATLGGRDADGDTYVDALCCNVTLTGTRVCGDDCNDRSASTSPVGTELCNGADDDCDGTTDEGALQTFFRDVDGDGFGGHAAIAGDPLPYQLMSCYLPAGYSFTATDCDDHERSINPAAREICSLMGAATDEDCDISVDEGLQVSCFADADDDGWAATGATAQMACHVDFRPLVGGCPPNFTNRNPATSADCDDHDATRSPGATEVCSISLASVRDEDCSGAPLAAERDDDGDGYNECPNGSGLPIDCDDTDMRAHPGQMATFGPPALQRTTAGGWDFDCDGDQEPSLLGVSDCSISSAMCINGIGFWQTRVPTCGQTGQWITGCTNNVFSCSNVTMSRGQLCN